jgi:hypothetical protein
MPNFSEYDLNLTKVQKEALHLICVESGGSIQHNGTVLCGGRTGLVEKSPFHSTTWLKLVGYELIEGIHGRLVATIKGRLINREYKNQIKGLTSTTIVIDDPFNELVEPTRTKKKG